MFLSFTLISIIVGKEVLNAQVVCFWGLHAKRVCHELNLKLSVDYCKRVKYIWGSTVLLHCTHYSETVIEFASYLQAPDIVIHMYIKFRTYLEGHHKCDVILISFNSFT